MARRVVFFGLTAVGLPGIWLVLFEDGGPDGIGFLMMSIMLLGTILIHRFRPDWEGWRSGRDDVRDMAVSAMTLVAVFLGLVNLLELKHEGWVALTAALLAAALAVAVSQAVDLRRER